MKKIILLLFLSLISCKSSKSISSTKNTIPKVYYYNTGEIKSTGQLDIDYLPILEVKIGVWNHFYKNSQLKSSGKYKYETYEECCTSGICDGNFNYKIGKWVFYFPNGKIKAEGVFSINEKKIKTRCKNDAIIKYGVINKNWKFYNLEGKLIKPSLKYINEIENNSYNIIF